MGWIKQEHIHRCEKPEYDPNDVHRVGEYWQCDNLRCNQLWYIVTIGSMTTYDEDGNIAVSRELFYSWAKVSHKEHRWP